MHDVAMIQLGGHQRSRIPAAFAVVDAADAAWANQWKWSLLQGYAARLEKGGDGVKRQVRLHRALLGLEHNDGKVADHMNRDPLDNRRANLRVGTQTLNCQNTSSRRGSASRFRGVRKASSGKWQAFGHINGKFRHLGVFVSEDDAARAASEFRREHMPWAVEVSA